jgi:lipopolysaccharide transport system permease protein
MNKPAGTIYAQGDVLLQFLNPVVLLRHLWICQEQIYQYLWREIEVRYKGFFLGLLWSLAPPLVLLSTYTVVFGLILKTSGHTTPKGGQGGFALFWFSGLIVYNRDSKTLSCSPG